MGQPEAIPEAMPEAIPEAMREAIPVLPTSSSRRKLAETMSMLVGIRKSILVLSGVATLIYTEIRGEVAGSIASYYKKGLMHTF